MCWWSWVHSTVHKRGELIQPALPHPAKHNIIKNSGPRSHLSITHMLCHNLSKHTPPSKPGWGGSTLGTPSPRAPDICPTHTCHLRPPAHTPSTAV